jgi:uncharacterized protein
MRRFLVILTLLFSFCASAQIESIIANPPKPAKLVNDYTNTLTPQQKEALEAKLYRYDDSTSNQIVIVMVDKLEGYSIDDAAIELGRKWGVGNKDFNNGVVVFVAKSDRKLAIQVGYGLEGALTDLATKSIRENTINPNFKAGNFYRGLDEGTDDIIKAAEGRYKAPEGYSNRKKKGVSIGTIIFIIIILLIVFGGAAGPGGTYVSRGGFGGWNGGGGWRGGGWSGGGSSGGGGGGFGGFGGGSFGGGGSSGSW